MRMLGHAIHDGAEYVPRELLAAWEARDPVQRYRTFLCENSVADEDELAELTQRAEVEITDAIARAEASPLRVPASLFEGVFA